MEQLFRELKTAIKTDATSASRSLATLPHDVAASPELEQEALILSLEYHRTEDETGRDRLKQKMLLLVDRIAAEHAAFAQSEETRARQHSAKVIQEHFSQIEPRRDVVFESSGLDKAYRRGNFCLSGVDLTLRLGEITGVVGENANGKTTLFRIVAGELTRNGGTMSFPFLQPGGSSRIDWRRVKDEMAYVPQELPHWYGSLEDNLQYEAALHGVRGQDNVREVKFIVERMRLTDHLGKQWSELSGGFKLRFALAKALVWKPKLLLIDEPLANLDFKAQQVILQDLRDMADGLRYPMSVMISSQHIHEVEAVADNILFLSAGRVIFNDSIDKLGANRKRNTYELNCPLDTAELTDCLAGLAESVHFNGLAQVITTSVEVDQRAILTRLLERGVQVDYFRDISRSIKQLFSSTVLF